MFQEEVIPSYHWVLWPDPMFTERKWGTVCCSCVKSTILVRLQCSLALSQGITQHFIAVFLLLKETEQIHICSVSWSWMINLFSSCFTKSHFRIYWWQNDSLEIPVCSLFGKFETISDCCRKVEILDIGGLNVELWMYCNMDFQTRQ